MTAEVDCGRGFAHHCGLFGGDGAVLGVHRVFVRALVVPAQKETFRDRRGRSDRQIAQAQAALNPFAPFAIFFNFVIWDIEISFFLC